MSHQQLRQTSKNISNMSNSKPNFKLSIQVEKEGLTVKNSIQKPTSHFVAERSIYQIASLPAHLASSVEKALSLPIQLYDLELQNIISMAIIGRQNQRTRYIAPLDPRIVINHWDPIFHTPELTCCKYDEQTVITFSDDEENSPRVKKLN